MIKRKISNRQLLILCFLPMLIIITAVIGMSTGYSALSYDRLIPTILGEGTFKEEFVLLHIRLPRIAVTLLAGMALSLSGAVLQGITRNDLADPGIIGINSGAGVAIALLFLFFTFNTGWFVFLLPLAAFAGALLTACIIYAFSYNRQQGLQPTKLVIIGTGCSMALSGLMIILIASAERIKVDFIAKWLAGNIWGTDWPFVLALLPWLIVLIPYTLYKANHLNIMALSEPAAVGLGISLEKERLKLLLAAVALAASAVSVTGGIAFIGLMAPHLAKSLVGSRHQLSIPATILLGGWLLMVADTLGHNMAQPEGIPAGIMAALVGAPYFIYLLVKR